MIWNTISKGGKGRVNIKASRVKPSATNLKPGIGYIMQRRLDLEKTRQNT